MQILNFFAYRQNIFIDFYGVLMGLTGGTTLKKSEESKTRLNHFLCRYLNLILELLHLKELFWEEFLQLFRLQVHDFRRFPAMNHN